MVLLYLVVQVLVLSQLTWLRQPLVLLECGKGWGVSNMFICVDDMGSLAIASIESFAEEPLGCLGITLGTQEKIQGISVLGNRSVQPSALAFDFDKDFIDSPRVTSWA